MGENITVACEITSLPTAVPNLLELRPFLHLVAMRLSKTNSSNIQIILQNKISVVPVIELRHPKMLKFPVTESSCC